MIIIISVYSTNDLSELRYIPRFTLKPVCEMWLCVLGETCNFVITMLDSRCHGEDQGTK